MDICQMEKAHQSLYEKSLELQLYDFQDFPEINVDPYGITIEKFVSGELMKSGKPRPKNAISFIMKCGAFQDFHECIDLFVMDFIQKEFLVDFTKNLDCSQAFVRLHLPTQSAEELPDFSISAENMKVLLDRNIYLDFWFSR